MIDSTNVRAQGEMRELSQEYRCEGELGKGGFSFVIDAYRISDGLHTAIKVLSLPTNLETEEAELMQKRFYREARLMASLKNEHIIECLDYGLFTGEPCIVLEYSEGTELGAYLKQVGGLPLDIAVDIACQILDAMGAAHEKGIVHRDIKPDNIMVIGENPMMVKLLDFGIATLLEGNEDDVLRTKVGSIRGTPSYMAPELFSGMVRASAESDIYALGLVLAECITGNVCVMGTNLMQIAYKQVHEHLFLPGYIPTCLADVIRRCCEKKPANRYHSAREVIDALQEVLPQAMEQQEEFEAAYLAAIKNGENETVSATGQHVSLNSMEMANAVITTQKTFIIAIAAIALIAIIGVLIGVWALLSSQERPSEQVIIQQATPAAPAAPTAQDPVFPQSSDAIQPPEYAPDNIDHEPGTTDMLAAPPAVGQSAPPVQDIGASQPLAADESQPLAADESQPLAADPPAPVISDSSDAPDKAPPTAASPKRTSNHPRSKPKRENHQEKVQQPTTTPIAAPIPNTDSNNATKKKKNPGSIPLDIL